MPISSKKILILGGQATNADGMHVNVFNTKSRKLVHKSDSLYNSDLDEDSKRQSIIFAAGES